MAPRKTPEERAAEVAELTERLNESVAALANSDQWRRMLTFAAKFHNYSPRNVFLLMLQAEERGMDLSRVAGFNTWKSLGYMVRKGERSLAVLAPVKRRLTHEEAAKLAAQGKAGAYDSEGRPAIAIRGWRLERVFDRSQVELMDGHEPMPEGPSWISQHGDGPAGLFDALCDLIRAEGFEIEHRPPVGSDDGAHGWSDYTRRIVWIRSDVDLAEATRVAAHELAHLRCAHEHREITRAQRECEADSVAFVVAAAAGLDIEDSSTTYILNWTKGESDLIEAAARTVQITARSILADLDAAETNGQAA